MAYVGCQRYFLTFCTFERARHFADSGVVDAVYAQVLRTSAEHAFAVPAYCFMPDHLHLLVEGTSAGSDLESFVAMAKQRGAYAARCAIRARLWQPGYFERVLRDDDDTFSVARYVVQNPVRAGLVSSPAEYPYLGSSILTRDELLGSCLWSPYEPRRKDGVP